MTFHILITDQLDSPGRATLHAADDAILSGPYKSRAAILAALPEADAVIIRASTHVDAEFLAAAPRLRVIARAGERVENIDVEAATRLGILVLNVPDVNVTAVVEHTFGLLLALARAIPAGHSAMRRGEWPRHAMRGFLLAGKTLGIIGFGQTGRAMAARAQAFEMNALVYDPYIDLSFARQQGVEIVNFPELLGRADILSLHTAYSAQTDAIMDAAAFAQMKPGSYFINCTHPGLVDETALLQALESGILAGAALDQFSVEPPPPDAPLRLHPKVLVTPHLSENTVESQRQTSIQIAEDTLAALRGDDYRNVVNLPFTPETPYQAVRPYIHLAAKLGKLQGQLADGWITRIEVELLGEGLDGLVRPVAAVLLNGLLRPVACCVVNWVSAPMLAHEQGITTAQVKGLVEQADYPNLIACKIYWEGGERTVAGVLFGNGEARLVQYDQFEVDAYPEGYVLILENDDVPGVIGKVGARLGRGKINVAQWRYGRERPGGQAVSFINMDDPVPAALRAELEREPEIRRARLVRL